ncbi:MAG: MFS transporter [Gammaproteobacteria bacterium]|nr:MFS transporter [Gammaproteobacteria bacterium]
MSSKNNFFIAAAPLLLILFIDGMGLGLVFPILNNLIVDPSSHFIALSYSESARNFIFGAIVASFMLSWFFGAPFLGDLSDNIGRKKSLMICLIGATLGYLISAVGIMGNSIVLLILGRIVAGFTSGSQPIAQAAIIDISEPQHKTRNISYILLALSLGFIFGPLLGGVLSDKSIQPWFNFSLPFFFAAGISLLNALFLQFLFIETFTKTQNVKIKLHRAIEIFIAAFRHEKIRVLSLIFLIMVFGWSSFYTFISMYLLKKYNFDAFHITLFMAFMGVGFGIGNGFLANFCAKRFNLRATVIVTLFLGSVGILITVMAERPLYAWWSIIPIAALLSVAYALILTIFSNQVSDTAQGWVMGITGAIMALTFGINSLMLGLLSTLGVNVPLYISISGLAASAMLMFLFKDPGDKSRVYNPITGH